jgi:hypothetical protein
MRNQSVTSTKGEGCTPKTVTVPKTDITLLYLYIITPKCRIYDYI